MNETMDWRKITEKANKLIDYTHKYGWSIDDTLCALSEAINLCTRKRYEPAQNEEQCTEKIANEVLTYSDVIEKSYEALNWARNKGWTWEETTFAFIKAASTSGYEVVERMNEEAKNKL